MEIQHCFVEEFFGSCCLWFVGGKIPSGFRIKCNGGASYLGQAGLLDLSDFHIYPLNWLIFTFFLINLNEVAPKSFLRYLNFFFHFSFSIQIGPVSTNYFLQ